MTDANTSAYREIFLPIAQEMVLDEAMWLLNGGGVRLDELLVLDPPSGRFALLTYDAQDNAYAADYYERSSVACDAAAETLMGFSGYVVALVDLLSGRPMNLAVRVDAL